MRNHTCITAANPMNPDWNHTCTGLHRWGFTHRPKLNAGIVLAWIKNWELKDILSLTYSPPGENDLQESMVLVLRLENLPWYNYFRRRYDYVMPMADNEDPLKSFDQPLQVLHNGSTSSEWAYVYDAFVQILQKFTGGPAVRECLLHPNSSVELVDTMITDNVPRFPEVRCYGGVDKNMWDKWQFAYNAFKDGAFRQQWSFATIHLSLKYDVFNAYWTGLMGALISACVPAIAFLLYYFGAVGHACLKLRKRHRLNGHARPIEMVGRFVPVQHTRNEDAMLIQGQAGREGSAM